MTYTDNELSKVVHNFLTRAQYDELDGLGQILPNEFYYITDENQTLTETALYVLSGLDEDITTGEKCSHTILEEHSFLASDIYLEVTTGPTDFAIVVDILKNGVSIFSTKPQIAAGSLHLTVAPVLTTSPVTFAVGDIRKINVDSVGSTETGKNLILSTLINK